MFPSATSVLTRWVTLIKRFAAKKAGVEDGEINNRKAFLDNTGVVGSDNGRQKTEIMVPTSLQAGSCTNYSDHLLTCAANPKLKSTGAGRYQLLSRWWDAYRKQLG